MWDYQIYPVYNIIYINACLAFTWWKWAVKCQHWDTCHKCTQDWWLQKTQRHRCNVAAVGQQTGGATNSDTVGTWRWRWTTAGLWWTRGTSGGGAGATKQSRTADDPTTTKLRTEERHRHPMRHRKGITLFFSYQEVLNVLLCLG